MKRLQIGIATFIILGLIAIPYKYYLNHHTNELRMQVEQVLQYAQKGDWDQVEKSMEELKQNFLEKRHFFGAVTEHNEIDNMQITVGKMAAYAKEQDYKELMAEGSSLKMQLEHLPQKDALTLENLF